MPSVEQVRAALKTVKDPEIPLSLVDLGLIYDIQTTDSTVRITMTLTTPGCGMAREIAINAKQTVMQTTGCNDVLVTVTFDPPWTKDLISEEGKKSLGL